MTYTEKELNQFLHGISLSLLSKKSAQHWRYDEETAKEIEWLEALERKVRADKADRKTENGSEIPTGSTISKMEQVDEPQYEKGFKDGYKAKEYDRQSDCDGCRFIGIPQRCEGCCRNYADGYKPIEIEDEPQTDCAWRRSE